MKQGVRKKYGLRAHEAVLNHGGVSLGRRLCNRPKQRLKLSQVIWIPVGRETLVKHN